MEKITLPELPVLIDFDLFLTFLRTHRQVPVTGSSFHLKQADLFRLNAEMYFKASWVSEKSRQPHYPLLDFFYHVVIASKLVRVHHEKKGVYLKVVPEQLEKYDLMMHTERYFLLLETLWCHMNWEELTGARSLYFAETVLEVLELMALSDPGQVLEVRDRSVQVQANKPPLHLMSRKAYEVLWFLGFYDLVPDTTLTKRPESHEFPYTKFISKELSQYLVPVLLEQRPLEFWNLSASQETDIFSELEGIMDLLVYKPEVEIPEEETTEKPDEPFIEAFKPLFAPEDLSEDFYVQQESFEGGRYTIRIALSKKVYRTIAIGASATLEDLHLAIQKIYNFDDDHLYAFYMDGKEWSEYGIYSPDSDRPPFTNEVKLGELDLYTGKRFVYLFDFGDRWLFELVVQKIEPKVPEPGKAIVIEEKGEAPPQYWEEDEDDDDAW
ncbi:plasmid pRiA4b ORF-3 family protein [Pontibacter pamirensis]|uniref:plasmid pRiA4b ORF-3 family protein n=1 Tax=Pontibacter pamirensis TaxID=2562824 RepID=UPI0013899342|nr:plasmid pRiA4b ORF-3 family protein [Pontibacter pamirensis]